MIRKIEAIISLVPGAQVVVRGEEVEWYEPSVAPVTEEQIQEEMVRLQAEAQVAVEAQVAAKQSALNKLMALGLTEEEALALGVK
jgi:hypothetical protein